MSKGILHNQTAVTIDKTKETISRALVFLLTQPGVEPPMDLLWSAYALRGANVQSYVVLYEEAKEKWPCK